MEEIKKQIKVQIALDEQTANGKYSNGAVVNHSESEFVLDFIFLQPQAPKATVLSRIISSPSHAKRLMLTLQENIRRYEEKYGEINLRVPVNPGEIDFLN